MKILLAILGQLRTVISPFKMYQNRKVTVFLSIMIIFAASYVMALPSQANIIEVVDLRDTELITLSANDREQLMNIVACDLVLNDETEKYEFTCQDESSDIIITLDDMIILYDFGEVNPITEENDTKILAFTKEEIKLYYVDNVMVDADEKYEYFEGSFDFSSVKTGYEVRDEIVRSLEVLRAPIFSGMLPLLSLLQITFYTLVVAIVSWIVIRSRGKLRGFKQYFNVASFVLVVPLLIATTVGFFAPLYTTQVYNVVYMVYYTYVIYTIQTKVDQTIL